MPTPPVPRSFETPRVQQDFQADFSGGDASATEKIYLRPNQSAMLHNLYIRRGGGLTARKGFTNVPAAGGAGSAGRNIFELETTIPTVLTFVAAGPSWYEEQMQPRYRLFNQVPGVGDAVYIGAREKFNQLVLFTVFAYVVPGNTFVWEVSNGAGGWIDKTAQITASVANSLNMQGAVGEWIFTWPDFADWLPQQVETRLYQLWLRIRCTASADGGSDVVQGQRLVSGDMLGRRLLLTAGETTLRDWPGFTTTTISLEVYSATRRVRGVMFNDYFYYASDGLRPLRRWNLARGVTRAAVSNNPTNAGLSAPPALNPNAAIDNVNGYPAGTILRYRASCLYGPEGKLGEGPPGPSVEYTVPVTASGAANVQIDLTAIITFAATRDVHAIMIYVTDDLVGTPFTLRDDIGGFYLITTVLRDGATWNALTYVDAYAPKTKTEPTPIAYTNTPPFKPKYVAKGGERLWIADDFRVAWSDIGRGDSWNPSNQKTFFPNIKGIVYREDRLLVAHEEDWSYVYVPPVGLPDIQFFYRGLGNVQPDAITVGDGNVFFMSRLGPAVIRPGGAVRRIGPKRVWESANYWTSKAGERPFAMGAYHDRRWWIPIDSGGTNQYVGRTAVYDNDDEDGAWSRMNHNESGVQEQVWAALKEIHAPLDHALARQLVLVGFPDKNGTAATGNMRLLEYGTSDMWTSLQTDGTKISGEFNSRAIALESLQLWKSFQSGHVRYKLPGVSGCSMSVQLLADIGASSSTLMQVTDGYTTSPRDFKCLWTEQAGKGPFREVAPQLKISFISDSGFDIYSWWLDAELEAFSQR